MTAPNYQAIGTPANGTSGAVVPVLPAHAAGDLLVLIAEGDNASFGSDPAGWTLVGVVSGTANKLAVWYKIAASNAETDPTITPTTGNHTFAHVISFRNVHQVKPIHARAVGSTNTSSVIGALGLDTHVDDCMILQIVGWGADNTGGLVSAEANGTLANLAERIDAGTTDGNGGGIIAYTGEKAAAGAVDQTTFTLAASTAAAMMTLAIAPIADKVAASNVTIAGSPAPNGGNVRAIDLTQLEASYLARPVVTTGGTGAFSILTPYDDHDYQIVFENGASYGASAVDQAV